MALHESRAENLVLPVGTTAEERGVGVSFIEIVLIEDTVFEQLALIACILAQIHHLEPLGGLLPSHIAVVCYVGVACAAATSSDENHAVGACRTVYGTCRRIFEHIDIHNIARRDGRERIDGCLAVAAAHPVETADRRRGSVHRHTVDDVQRLVGRVERARTAYSDRGCTAGSAGVLRHLHTGNLALQHLVGIGDNGLSHLVFRERCHRTGDVALALCAVAHHHHLVEAFGVLA